MALTLQSFAEVLSLEAKVQKARHPPLHQLLPLSAHLILLMEFLGKITHRYISLLISRQQPWYEHY